MAGKALAAGITQSFMSGLHFAFSFSNSSNFEPMAGPLNNVASKPTSSRAFFQVAFFQVASSHA